MRRYDDVTEVLTELRRRGLVVAVCSNWYWHLEEVIAEVGLTGLVDVVVTSARAGARKPHPLIFHQTLEQCGLQPAEAMFVGDLWEPDVLGPLSVGIRPAHLWRVERSGEADPPRRADVPRLSTLHELLKVINVPK